MNIAEASTNLSQMQLQQEAAVRMLRTGMENAEMQAEEVNRMAEASPQPGEQVQPQQQVIAGQVVQEGHLGNIIDLQA